MYMSSGFIKNKYLSSKDTKIHIMHNLFLTVRIYSHKVRIRLTYCGLCGTIYLLRVYSLSERLPFFQVGSLFISSQCSYMSQKLLQSDLRPTKHRHSTTPLSASAVREKVPKSVLSVT